MIHGFHLLIPKLQRDQNPYIDWIIPNFCMKRKYYIVKYELKKYLHVPQAVNKSCSIDIAIVLLKKYQRNDLDVVINVSCIVALIHHLTKIVIPILADKSVYKKIDNV